MLKEVGGLTDQGKEFVSLARRGEALVTIDNYYRFSSSPKSTNPILVCEKLKKLATANQKHLHFGDVLFF